MDWDVGMPRHLKNTMKSEHNVIAWCWPSLNDRHADQLIQTVPGASRLVKSCKICDESFTCVYSCYGVSFLRVGFQTENFEVVGTNGNKFSLDSTLPTDCDVVMRSTDPFAKYLVGPAYNGEWCLMLLMFHIPIAQSIMQGGPHKGW